MYLWMAALALAQTAPTEGPEPAAAAAHVANAHRIAGSDLAPVADGYMCRGPAAGGAYLGPIVKNPAIVSGRAFDNLYYVGKSWVGAWALVTGDGIVLIDAMNNADEAETIIAPELRKLGLDPAQVKLIIVTHGHYDHFGGADWFSQKYGTRIMMSTTDWAYAADPENSRKLGIPFVAPPARDLIAEDGAELVRGDTKIRIVETPGHTPGTISLLFQVKDRDKTRWVSQWGGTAMPRTSAGLSEYHGSFHKFRDAANAVGAVSGISAHPFVDDTLGRLQRVKPGKPSPFVGKPGSYDRFMQVHEECILAMSARYQAWGW
jgi:metallo-beta-lactamase class B